MPNINSHIILFDGICNLCNSSVQFIIRHDSRGKFKFASIQSEFGKEQMLKYQIDRNKTDSVILIYSHLAYVESTAALKIALKLDGPWPVLYSFIIIPPFIRNFFYRIIAKNRYRWFGKKESCMVPNPELKSRFLG